MAAVWSWGRRPVALGTRLTVIPLPWGDFALVFMVANGLLTLHSRQQDIVGQPAASVTKGKKGACIPASSLFLHLSLCSVLRDTHPTDRILLAHCLWFLVGLSSGRYSVLWRAGERMLGVFLPSPHSLHQHVSICWCDRHSSLRRPLLHGSGSQALKG